METLECRLDFYVNKALDAYVKTAREQSPPALPIDLYAVAREIGNIDIEAREMIPEAAVQLEGDGLRSICRRTFWTVQERCDGNGFHLAHEIAHAFF